MTKTAQRKELTVGGTDEHSKGGRRRYQSLRGEKRETA